MGKGGIAWLIIIVKTARFERNMTIIPDHYSAGYGDGTRVGARDGRNTSRPFLTMRGLGWPRNIIWKNMVGRIRGMNLYDCPELFQEG
jgi:hypothetical protein